MEEAEKVQEIVAEGVAREGLREMVLPAEEAAARRLADFVSDAAIDRMIADAQDAGVSLLDGPGGLIGQLTARVIERALGAEMDDHLGYVKGDPAGNGTGNSRNGSYGKTLTTSSCSASVSELLLVTGTGPGRLPVRGGTPGGVVDRGVWGGQDCLLCPMCPACRLRRSLPPCRMRSWPRGWRRRTG